MRKSQIITIDNNSRDHGKAFKITEMSAYEGERLAADIFYGLNQRKGVEPDPAIIAMGLVGLNTLGFAYLYSIDPVIRDTIKDKLMTCISIPSPSGQEIAINLKTDIEEIDTIRLLLDTVMEITFDFLRHTDQ